MALTEAERAVALNLVTCRINHGGHPDTAMNEALGYARRREDEHSRRLASEWYRRLGNRFVPAWSGPDDAA